MKYIHTKVYLGQSLSIMWNLKDEWKTILSLMECKFSVRNNNVGKNIRKYWKEISDANGSIYKH